MMHAQHGTLLAWFDGQLTGPEASSVESHLAECGDCRVALDEVRSLASEVTEALNLISSDVPLAEARARFEARRAETAAETAGGIATVTAGGRLRLMARPWRFATAGMLKAAAVVLLLSGAVAAAIPGSPVQRWAAALIDRITGPDAPEATESPLIAEPTPSPAAAVGAVGSDIILPVQNGRVRVSLHAPDPSARIVVRLIDAAEGQIRSLSAEDEPRVRTGTGYLDVYGVRTGVIIEIPTNLRFARIDIDGVVYWEKDGSELHLLESAVEETGGEFVFRGRS